MHTRLSACCPLKCFPLARIQAGEALAALGKPELLDLLEEYSKDSAIEVSETCQIGARRLKWYSSEEGKAELAKLPQRYGVMIVCLYMPRETDVVGFDWFLAFMFAARTSLWIRHRHCWMRAWRSCGQS
jgi:hypothetical protein